ncbi:hypothetical protein [Microlunatus sp. Gsoil 973]|uniref:hypothetical protein n=1 Tax=Microlunatus sp. Gsoil 973 TaxID=2672569 RepID=UPI0012B44D00|nr:hypothetical protein [Microlunatus sp. Gsoil 973]QGN33562.1 hypothetical protein GJV80_12930 [Microlunatus sp. Gsoil 973]
MVSTGIRSSPPSASVVLGCGLMSEGGVPVADGELLGTWVPPPLHAAAAGRTPISRVSSSAVRMCRGTVSTRRTSENTLVLPGPSSGADPALSFRSSL